MTKQPFDPRGLYLKRDASNALPLPDFNRDSLVRTLEVRSFDADARTVELAFSSEIEVDRWFGIEILDHDTNSVDMARLLNGGAVLVDHDWRDQVGVVISATIDGGAVLLFGLGAVPVHKRFSKILWTGSANTFRLAIASSTRYWQKLETK